MDSDFIQSGAQDIDDIEEEEFNENIDDDLAGVSAEPERAEEKNLFSNPVDNLLKHHPECVLEYQETEEGDLPLESVPPQGDKKHRSMPFLSIFEKTRILGMRTNQLAQGARPFIEVPDYISDVQEIAQLELDQRRLPIIIKRYMPDGTYEKFRLSDLMMI
jgi:DNA-directed RNA polymerase I, II, and III subunit RPABC2